MVLETERYSSGGIGGGFQQQNYSSFEEYNNGGVPNSQYSNYPASHTAQYPSYPNQHHQSGWSSGADHHGHGHGGNHYSGAVKPTSGGYGDSYYGHQHGHGGQHGYGSPPSHGGQHGYGVPPSHGGHHGYGSPTSHGGAQGYGNSQGYSYGSGLVNKVTKLTHVNHHGSPSPNYGHSPSGFNHGNQKPSWVLKGLDDE